MTTRLASETSVSSATIPESGQPIEVRRRQWTVSDVDAWAVVSELPERNLVKLASIDEDALGEEIDIAWELEPRTHVLDRAGMLSLSGLEDPELLHRLSDLNHQRHSEEMTSSAKKTPVSSPKKASKRRTAGSQLDLEVRPTSTPATGPSQALPPTAGARRSHR